MFKPFSRAQGNLKGPFPISSVRDYCTVFKRMIDSLKFNKNIKIKIKISGNICDLQKNNNYILLLY